MIDDQILQKKWVTSQTNRNGCIVLSRTKIETKHVIIGKKEPIWKFGTNKSIFFSFFKARSS